MEHTEYTRRRDDDRISRIEDNVTNIRAKIENGLSTRSIENSNKLSELYERNEQIEVKLVEHIIGSRAAHDQSTRELRTLKEIIEKVAKNQSLWGNLFKKMLIGIIIMLLGTISWMFVNIDTIVTIVDNLTYYKVELREERLNL